MPYESAMVPGRMLLSRSEMRARIEQLEDCLADCAAFIRGDISGSAQKESLLRLASTLLGDNDPWARKRANCAGAAIEVTPDREGGT